MGKSLCTRAGDAVTSFSAREENCLVNGLGLGMHARENAIHLFVMQTNFAILCYICSQVYGYVNATPTIW